LLRVWVPEAQGLPGRGWHWRCMVMVPPPQVTLHGPQSCRTFQSPGPSVSPYFGGFAFLEEYMLKASALSTKGDLMTAEAASGTSLYPDSRDKSSCYVTFLPWRSCSPTCF
jgi:hypothetical protein